MRRVVVVAMLALGLPHSPSLRAATQDTGVLRITVVLTAAEGTVTPIPRVVLLISDNPATTEPRRVRTGVDGAVEVTLRAGNYTVESDAPVTLGTQSYAWTQMIDVTAGSNVLSLTPANADISIDTGGASGGVAPMRADSAAIFTKWRHSVVEIWTPTAHASGFLIDSRGLIATNDRAIGDAIAVEVEFTLRLAGDDASSSPRSKQGASDRFKIAGRVIASDPQQGVAIVWIDPATVAAIPVITPDCNTTPGATIRREQKVVSLIAPLLEPKHAILGTVGRVEPRLFHVDWRLTGGAAGGPVFDTGGGAIGITLVDDEREQSGRRDSQAVPLGNACRVLAAAEKRMSRATPPPAARLRVEDSRAATRARNDKPTGWSAQDPKAPRLAIPTVSSSNFDVSLSTPAMVDSDPARWNLRTDFGSWNDYVANAPPVLLVRVTPQFEESLWKTILRGAAATQGAALPPLKSFGASFLRLRAFCGAAEVGPIHPFIIVREVQDRASIREGLYVFAVADFGPHCATVRFDLYSEKAPDRADSLTVDPGLFAQIAGVTQ